MPFALGVQPMSRLALLLFSISLVTACVPPAYRKPSAGRLGAGGDRAQAFARALALVQSRSWMVATSDRAGGLLTTQATAGGPVRCGRGRAFTCASRSTLQVTIAEDGSVIVNLNREVFHPQFSTAWMVPHAEAEVREIEAEQEEILRVIVGGSPVPRQTPAAPPEQPGSMFNP